ncbi:hypothetical protein SLA2020_354730 [Shorea laevis]
MLHRSRIFLLNSKNRTQAHVKMTEQAHHNGPHLSSSSQIPEKGGRQICNVLSHPCARVETRERLAWLFAREGGDELM